LGEEGAANEFDLTAEGVHVGRDQGFLPGVGVEVAVGAAVNAKGDVEIERIVHREQRTVIPDNGCKN
jgi:hypothetical protein